MGLANVAKEIIDTWQFAINEGRPLTQEEIRYIMDLQDKAIIEELGINDGLSEEEFNAEHIQDNYFKDRDKIRHESS